jgi:uncharacterized protein (DUF488 family)
VSVTPPSPLVIHTVGHSTRTAEVFLGLLEAHGIRQLADVRAFPGSRRHPHFSQGPLDAFLAAAGIRYRHFPGLGGHRKPRPDSINTGLRHPSFRGYADYMLSDAFRISLDELQVFAADGPTAVMCAEAVWWQCHRRLLADALFVRNVVVRHILSRGEAKPHQLSEFARELAGGVTYPGLL